MKDLELCRAWDAAFDAVMRLNVVALKIFAAEDRFAEPDELPFQLRENLSVPAKDEITKRLGAPTGTRHIGDL